MDDERRLLDRMEAGAWGQVLEAVRADPALLATRFGWAGQTPLHLAVIAGDPGPVTELLGIGADVALRDRADEATPLHWAADRGSVELCRLLVAGGADPDDDADVHGWGPLGWATLGEATHAGTARWLIDAGARPRLFPLIALDDAPGLEALLDRDPAAAAERLSMWEHHESALHFAIARGTEACFDVLVAAGADVDELDWLGLSPLAVAGFHGRDDMARRLEARGALPDLSAHLAWGRDDEARTEVDPPRAEREDGDSMFAASGRYGRLLHYAAENGHERAVGWLIEQGADPSGRRTWWDNELTPLHTAASHGHLEAARVLVDGGADLAARDACFDSPPEGWATHHGHSAVARFLAEAGRSPP